MTLDAFRARLGLDQGRLRAASGAVFVLGAQTPGRMHVLAAGDYAEIVQRIDLTDADLVRVTATCRAPTVPTGLAWSLLVRVDGVTLAQRRLPSGRTIDVRDLAASVAALNGEHEIAVRLELMVV